MNKHSQSSSTSFATGPRPKSSYFPNSAGIFKSLMNGAAGLAALVLLIAPSVSTLISMVTALVLLALVLRLKTLGSRTRLLSIRVPTELTLLTTTLVLCVILAEFGLRLFLFQSFLDVHRFPQITGNVGYWYDRTLGWFPIPNSKRIFTSPTPITISISHNSKGFRDAEPVFDDRPRIVFVGDSFTWGYDVQAADRFTEKLRARHPEWNIFNFGVVGYSTDQEDLLLRRRIGEYEPDVVFLIFCTENDDQENCSNSGGGVYFKPYFIANGQALKLRGVPVPKSDRIFCLAHPVLSKSYLIRLAIRAHDNFVDPPPKFEDCPTTAILSDIQRYLSARGIALLIELTDSHPQLERFLQVSGLPFVNLSKAPRLGPGDHWNAAGHTFVCDRVEKFLVSGKYLRKKEQRPAAPGTFPGESTHFSSEWPQPPPSWLGHP